jgi:hypothetical protein
MQVAKVSLSGFDLLLAYKKSKEDRLKPVLLAQEKISEGHFFGAQG